ncbi:hypothetical protein DICPUDRAFT_89733 [Dictyostelium purpureum]|uniref:Uncharacterized protein n=1 Tax=Dictyostelium purpureum TaxID=5786 RepID=F0ZXU3_DICPU|nr:uncharacterized protein DICPUDRAFT_89733 [Dictyostelium purpureum]EGC31232.1 hypothetical protein DICPUDRAFT_89733 [Dictyostelium purpureum]|eukprot:XP_003292235.1 hypothetical protein DICPUDRAFT_89733 [Dictyostelium purpureum]
MENGNIFISIISYRDSECQWTIKNLIENSNQPNSLYIGVCLQYDMGNGEGDKHCFEYQVDKEYESKHIRYLRMDYRDAKGPCYARALVQQQLYRDEEYYLQIDSHMRFVKDWDKILIEQLQMCKVNGSVDTNAILTCYPMGYTLPNKIPVHRYPILLVATQFGDDGFLRLGGKIISKKLDSPCKSLFWVSGFSFSRSNVIKEVPYDPNLQHLFFGEEISMSARLYTHGFNFYSPTKTIIFHLWNRDYRPTFRENKSDETIKIENHSKKRLLKLFGLENDNQIGEIESKYGLGATRTLENYSDFSGVDFKNKSLNNNAKFGGYFEEKDTFFMNEIMEFVIKSQIGI